MTEIVSKFRQIDGKIVYKEFWLWNFRPRTNFFAENVNLTKKIMNVSISRKNDLGKRNIHQNSYLVNLMGMSIFGNVWQSGYLQFRKWDLEIVQ